MTEEKGLAPSKSLDTVFPGGKKTMPETRHQRQWSSPFPCISCELGNTGNCYPKPPTPTSPGDDKPSDNEAKCRQGLKEYHVKAHPLTSFMKKEYVPDNDPGQNFSTAHGPRANNARSLKAVEIMARTCPNARQEGDCGGKQSRWTQSNVRNGRYPPKNLVN